MVSIVPVLLKAGEDNRFRPVTSFPVHNREARGRSEHPDSKATPALWYERGTVTHDVDSVT